MSNLSIYLYLFLISISFIHCQQLQWILLKSENSGDSPPARRDAALGFDSTFLVLYGGRDQSGMPRDDSYAFNIMQGFWEPLNFPNQPPSRYGMASASSFGNGLYIFGGFGTQGSTPNYNPYLAYGSAGLPSYRSAPVANDRKTREAPAELNSDVSAKRNPAVSSKQYFNQMNPSGYNRYRPNDDRADENYYPMSDVWYLSYLTKTWQQTQQTQYARGLGSAAASPYSSGMPRIIYSMGKSRDWMYSTVETTGQVTSGYNQFSGGQSAIIMYDLHSFSPAYPHARYGHSTTLLTDNHLLLFGGCLSGYGKGGPCPSSDTWLLHLDRGHWERLWECPTTKTGAAMVTLPSFDMCSSMGNGFYGRQNMGGEPPVAILWGGREFTRSSIRSYISPQEEVAVFTLNQKEWTLRRASPASTGGYPIQREGAAYVAGCFQGAPGMFVYGGRSVYDGRLLNDLWFLQASPQAAMTAPRSRGCIYPFSFYHLHGIFQFFAYGVIFPIGYLVGRHAVDLSVRRPLHVFLQVFGVVLAICGFSFGVHSVRAPSYLHFRHAHAIIGIITFIITIIQFFVGLIGACILGRGRKKAEGFSERTGKGRHDDYSGDDSWGGKGTWRIGHRILGALVLALGFTNISLGVFLAVLPLAVWIIWFIYLGFLFFILVGMELVALVRRGCSGTSKKKSIKNIGGREDPKGTSQSSLKYSDEPMDIQPVTRAPPPRRDLGRPPLEPMTRENNIPRRGGGEERAPLIPSQRQTRPGDVSSSAALPEYPRPNEREYPIPARKRSGPAESDGFDYYVGYAPEHAQPLPRSTNQQQNEHNLTRVRLQ